MNKIKVDKIKVDIKPSTLIWYSTTEWGIHVLHENIAYYLSWEDFFKYAERQDIFKSLSYKTVRLRKPPKIKELKNE